MPMIMDIPVRIDGEQAVNLPDGAEILDVVTVAGVIRLIVKAKPIETTTQRRVVMCGTGHLSDPQIEDMRYAGTAVAGSLIFAVFVD